VCASGTDVGTAAAASSIETVLPATMSTMPALAGPAANPAG
jgi:hypothetical protein